MQQNGSYAYDDSEASDADQSSSDDSNVKLTKQEKDELEQHLWDELDIDEDRDEPVFKVLVIVVTLGVVAYFVRTYCAPCARHQDSMSRGRYATAGLGQADDPWQAHASRDSHEETSLALPPQLRNALLRTAARRLGGGRFHAQP